MTTPFDILLAEIENAPDEAALMVASLKIPSVAEYAPYGYDRYNEYWHLIRASGKRRVKLMENKIIV